MTRADGSGGFVCKLCHHERVGKTYVLRWGEEPPFDAGVCGACGLFQTLYDWRDAVERQADAELDLSEAGPEWSSEQELAANAEKARFFAEALAKRGWVQGKRVLDIGSGHGFFLQACRELGAAQVTGQEFFRDRDLRYSRHLGLDDVRTAPFSDLAVWPANEFDLVCSFDVVEHIHDLQAFFSDCLRVARPGGFLYHATPGADSLSHRLGRLMAGAGIRRLATPLCNVQPVKDPFGGPHVSIMGLRQLEWLESRCPFSVAETAYVNSYSYSDEHYAGLLPGLKSLPRPLGARLFGVVRAVVRNKLVFAATVHKEG